MRTLHGPRRIVAAASAALALLLLGALAPALAAAAPATGAAGKTVVRFQDYTLAQGQTVRSVVVIHGDAVIAGTVARSVVVVDGTATIESTAIVGADLAAQDSSIVVVGGRLVTEAGATIHGKTVRVAGFGLNGGLLRGAAASAIARPVGIITGWWQLLFLPIVALVVAGLFPRSVNRLSDRVREKFWPSFGWGVVGLLVAGVLLAVLAITIVGLILVVPAGLALPAILLFCFVGTAALVGRLVLSSSRYRDNVLAAAVVGALLASLVWLVPFIGGLAVLVATVAGFGAALTLVNEWRVARRSPPTPAAGGPPPGPAAPQWTPQPPGWTPPPPGWSWSPQQGWMPPAGAAPGAPGPVAPRPDAPEAAAGPAAGAPQPDTPGAGANPPDPAQPLAP
jgi:hypothetical protein